MRPIKAYINTGRVHAGKSLPHGATGQATFQRSLYPGIDRLQIGGRFLTTEHQPRYVKPAYKSPPQNGHIVFTWTAQHVKYESDVYETVDYLVEIPKSFFDRAQSYDAEWRKGNRLTFKTCDSKKQPWPSLCKANKLSCEYLQNPLPNPWR